MYRPGRHFLQIPGPTNVPDRVLRAIDAPTIDHRGPDFAELGLEVVWVEGDWRHGADPERAETILRKEPGIAAVMVVHNETSTGVTSRVPEIRAAIDAAGHGALLLVDTISSLGSIDYRHDEWGVDVTVGCSQKGLMLPAGLGFNAVSEKARAASRTARLPRSYWDWEPVLEANRAGFWPYTSPTNLLYGLREALAMLREEGLEAVFARHRRHAEATRRAVRAWGLEILCEDEREHSAALTAVLVPDGHDADEVRRVILERFDMSLGAGLGKVRGRVFRIGHLGDFNDLMLAGTLCGVEMGLAIAGVPFERGGVDAALEHLERAPGDDAEVGNGTRVRQAAAEPAA